MDCATVGAGGESGNRRFMDTGIRKMKTYVARATLSYHWNQREALCPSDAIVATNASCFQTLSIYWQQQIDLWDAP